MIQLHDYSSKISKDNSLFNMAYVPPIKCYDDSAIITSILNIENNITNILANILNIESDILDLQSLLENNKIKLTPEGGVAVKLTNKTGGTSVKGYCITAGSVNNSVSLVPIDAASCMGIFYESGIADGEEVWCVVSGIAEVYFWGNSTAGHLARTGLSADTGEVAGQALSEPYPTAPFATDKHFCEIGHVLESRIGAGLAKVNLHFN